MRQVLKAAALTLILPLLLIGCTMPTGNGEVADGPNVLRVIAGSEVKDLVPLLKQAEKEINVKVALDYSGTLEGAESIAAGNAKGKYDAAWFSSNRYLSLIGEAKTQIATSEKTMVSPVVLGVKTEKAKELGWVANPPTWQQLAEAAEAGKFTYGMTNPSASNSGFSALVAVATALSGGGAALDATKVQSVEGDLKKFFNGQTLTSGSSGWLADRFVETAGQEGSPDGIINYESVLLSLQNNPELKESMTVIYPTDGVVTADYPLTLLKSASDEKRELFNKLVAWLKKSETQQRIMADTARRPILPAVKLDAKFGSATLLELPFPGQRAAVDQLISTYLNKVRKPAQVVFVLDVSGSMNGSRLEKLKETMTGLAGGSSSTLGSFAEFRQRETIEIIMFSSDVVDVGRYDISEGNRDATLKKLTDDINNLDASGGTALYSALWVGYEKAAALRKAEPDRFTSVVLLTDGDRTKGISANKFTRDFREQQGSLRGIPTFAVLFGESPTDELQEIAKLTSGRVFDARKDGLQAAFQEIRGYQ